MRIAIVTTSYPLWDGQAAGHFVAAEARELSSRGHDVTVIAPGPTTRVEGSQPAVARIWGGGLFGPPGVLSRLKGNPARALGGVSFVLAARRALARRGPFDRLIGHWFIPSVWPLGIGHAPRVEGVVHGSDARLFASLPKAVREHVAGQLLQHRVTLRCVSEHVRDTLLRATTVALAGLVTVEPVLLDLAAAFDASRPVGHTGSSEQLVVVVARLVASKRVRVALEAVSALPDVRITVVGGGPLLPELRRAFPSVHFTGELSRPQTLAWIAEADVLVSASRIEGSPLVVREARALDTMVVASPAGDLERWAESDPGLWLAD